MSGRVWAALGISVWLGAVGAGLWVVWNYDNTPGASAPAPVQWPRDAAIRRTPGRPTLVLLAHPQCSCTAATLTELAEVLARARRQTDTYVLFLKPYGVPDWWERSPLWRQASALPGVTVLRDDDGVEAARFGAITSGQVVFYDEAGTLRFSGGITSSRAHAGDNAGRRSLVALLNQTGGGVGRTSVFGCSLLGSQG
jgi:hypothetical protein